jgi:hypothetical protein
MKQRSAFAAFAMVAVTLALVVEAHGAGTTVQSFTAKADSVGFGKYSGRIDSPKSRCVKHRRFEIVHDGVVIAFGRTNENGRFTAFGPEVPDGDTVKVKIKRKRGCRGASKSTTYRA